MSIDGLRHPLRLKVVSDDRARTHAPVGESPQSGTRSHRLRTYLCMAFFGVVFAGLAVRLGMVSLGDTAGPVIRQTAATQTSRSLVYDRNGRPLVLNRKTEGLAINGRDVWDVDEAVTTLVTLFPLMDAGRLRTQLEKKRYATVSTNITPEQKRQVIATGLPGLVFPDGVARAYPQKDLAAHVVGYTIPGRGGAVGVEKALDRGQFGGTDEPVRLSIDAVAQQILEDELAAAIRRYSAKAAWGVLLRADDGEVVALASLPDYNPNRPGGVSDAARRNRAMSDYYELGSAFKPLTVAMALEDGAVAVTDMYDVREPIEVGSWSIHDYSRKLKPLSVSEIVQHSSNIGTVKIVRALGRDRFVAGLKKLGLTKPLMTELPESRTPRLPQQWGEAELATASYGHGIAVTPLQLTAAFAAVVNGGIYHTPTFQYGNKQEGTRVFSEETSAIMRLVLRKAVTDGTGRKADAPGFYVGGKTATADKPENGRYKKDGKLISSFVGAFPGYNPQYVLLVSLDEPHGTNETHGYRTAGHVAAPTFRRVVERVAPPLGLMPVGDEVAHDGFVGMRREVAQLPPANSVAAGVN
ncbi:MAG: peptidoglycan D,D-transpeptidase FtsI family protein [Parvularcula sp.]